MATLKTRAWLSLVVLALVLGLLLFGCAGTIGYWQAWVYLALFMGLALGWYWGFLPLAGMLPFLIWRLLDEEGLLAAELPGYGDYQRTVRFRLVPGVWSIVHP